MLDCFGTLDIDGLVLLWRKTWKESESVVDVESIGASDLVAAVKAVALPFLRADYLPAVETVVDEFVLLCHAVAFHTLEVDLLWSRLLLFHLLL